MDNQRKAFTLQEYNKCQYKKKATLTLKKHLESVGSLQIGSFDLDEDDIKYLSRKFTISELASKELEQQDIIYKLKVLTEEIEMLKQIKNLNEKTINLILIATPIYLLYLAEVKLGSLTSAWNFIINRKSLPESTFKFSVSAAVVIIVYAVLSSIVIIMFNFIILHLEGKNDELYKKIESWLNRRNSDAPNKLTESEKKKAIKVISSIKDKMNFPILSPSDFTDEFNKAIKQEAN